MPREVTQEYLINSNPNTVLDVLILPGMIQKWWFANSVIVLPEEGGVYAISWGYDIDNPDYISVAKILRMRKPELLVLTDILYRSKEGPFPFDADIDVQFTLEPSGSQTILTVNQRGLPTKPLLMSLIMDVFRDGRTQWLLSKKTIKENS